ncbi:hypothetical protein C6N75_19935 [Streptomyces solincola]|uniref:Uncharacterized protein n=1 Tax=Streptomyces solincola TaxID=2100817 RepID=A0A2S9PSV4_9ACTN|nr:hypothetical protein C6N75_19935 [Streptomyces solincola]
MDGVSTYLALTFGTLLSSQGTDASFVLTLSGFPPGSFPSVLLFIRYFVFPTLPYSLSVPFPVWNVNPVAVGGPLPFGVFTTLDHFPRRFIIEPAGAKSVHGKA